MAILACCGCFRPFLLVGAVINKSLSERVDAILILAKRYWTATLGLLPVVAKHELSCYASLYTIGSRAPNACRTIGLYIY